MPEIASSAWRGAAHVSSGVGSAGNVNNHGVGFCAGAELTRRRPTMEMMTTVALLANTLHYPRGGGHRWAYLNWALGFRSIGCDVLWLEWLDPRRCREEVTVL